MTASSSGRTDLHNDSVRTGATPSDDKDIVAAKRDLSQTALAKVLRSSQSRGAKIGVGDSSVSLDLLVRSLLALGTLERELATIIARVKPAA